MSIIGDGRRYDQYCKNIKEENEIKKIMAYLQQEIRCNNRIYKSNKGIYGDPRIHHILNKGHTSYLLLFSVLCISEF